MSLGYYLADDSPTVIHTFPTGPMYGSSPHDIERGELSMETERGKHWTYIQFERKIPQYKFLLLTESHIAFFRTLDEAVQGDSIPFYFLPDVDASPLDVLYVRKEKDFKLVMNSEGGMVGGFKTPTFIYTLILTQEPTAAEIGL